jgi:hypothetical protein
MFAVPFATFKFICLFNSLLYVEELLIFLLVQILLEQETLQLHQHRLDAIGRAPTLPLLPV